MAYEVLARKWRPQQFADVVGQGHVTQTLQNAIKSNRLAHAYLFVGPRGIGKTSLARLFAKALNCEQGPTVTPCDRCDACREIAAGTSLDVMEIDGASNNSVEQVRELRENVKFAPTRGKFKIYLIDEVHMLSVGAFNALLKTLEEPPAHVKFFFATTEAHKVLPTIVSRCQRFDLRRIPAALIVERLQLIARAEKVELDPDAALAIARGAEGGLRDAESALDQLIAFRGNKIGEADVLSVFGLVSRRTLETLAGGVLSGDVAALVRALAELDEAGKDMQRLTLELIDHFRNLLVFLCAPGAAEAIDVIAAQRDQLAKQAALATPDQLLRIADILCQTEDRMRYALSKRTAIETALIRCARTTSVSIDELLRRVDALRKSLGADAAPPAAEAVPAAGSPPVRSARVRESAGAVYAVSAPAAPEPSAPVDELTALTRGWHGVVDKVGAIASLAKGLLLDARPLEVQAGKVAIGFDPEFARNMELMQGPHFHQALRNVLGQMLRRPVTVELRLMRPNGKPVDVPADHTAEGGRAAGGGKAPKTKQEWMKDPVVRKTLEMFNGSIVDVRE